MLRTLVLLLVASSSVYAIGETCTARGTAGTCLALSDCTGLSTPGFCPGPTNIQCCTLPTCTANGVPGICKKTSACSGQATPGFCPGPANVQCCTGGGGVEPPNPNPPNPEPPGPNPEPPGPDPEPPGPNPEPPGPNPEPPGPNPEPPGPNPEPPGPNPEPPGPNPEPPGPNPEPPGPDPSGPLEPIPPVPTDDTCTTPGGVVGYCVDTFFCKGTVTGGLCPGSASVKCCTNQPAATAVAGMDEYLPALAVQWGRKKNTNPYRVFEWLRRDLAETLEGGRARFGARFPGDIAVGRSWLIGRQEQMWFQSNPSGRGLSNFSPPQNAEKFESTAISGAGPNAKVSQLLINFAENIRSFYSGPGRSVSLGTYPGHGGGSFNDAGFSTDITISGRDERGFFPHDEAVAFCKAVHQCCARVGCDWRIIYNDFRVADEVNRFFGTVHNIFVGSARVQNGRATNLNWHGPLVLHFHLDIIPRAPTSAASISPPNIPENTRTIPLPPPPPPSGTGTACTVGTVAGICKNWRECDGDTTTGLCTGDSNVRCCTPRGAVPIRAPQTCRVGSDAGTCIPVSECRGTVTSNLCNGGSNIKCCTRQPGFLEAAATQSQSQSRLPSRLRSIPREASNEDKLRPSNALQP